MALLGLELIAESILFLKGFSSICGSKPASASLWIVPLIGPALRSMVEAALPEF
jgi:hypothetical protein